MGILHMLLMYAVLEEALRKGTFYENGRQLVEEAAEATRKAIEDAVAELEVTS